jgi:hypothetical protein
MTAIRAAFGIAPELYKDFAQLRRKVLDKARAEIDQLAHFTVDWREIRRGRTIVEIEFHFHPKSAPGTPLIVAEIEGHASGREVPQESAGKAIAVKSPALPAQPRQVLPGSAPRPPKTAPSSGTARFPSGSLQYAPGPFGEIARDHGGGWDRDLIAAAYREQMGVRLEGLTGRKLVKSWTGFCQAFAARRGRP